MRRRDRPASSNTLMPPLFTSIPPDVLVLLPQSCRRGITAQPSTPPLQLSPLQLPPLQLSPSPSLLPSHRPPGEGSLFALLKKIGWASSLSAGESGLSISSISFFYAKVRGLCRIGCASSPLALTGSPGILAFPCAQRWSSPRPEGARVVTLSRSLFPPLSGRRQVHLIPLNRTPSLCRCIYPP